MPGITDPTEAYFKDGTWGWDGTQWRKLAMVWGYSERYAEIELEEDVSAGDVTLTFSTVPDGEVWVVGVFSAYLFTGSTIDVHFRIVSSAGSQILSIQDTGTAHLTRHAPTPIILSKDDYLQVVFSGCPATANCYANVNGYKMKVAE